MGLNISVRHQHSVTWKYWKIQNIAVNPFRFLKYSKWQRGKDWSASSRIETMLTSVYRFQSSLCAQSYRWIPIYDTNKSQTHEIQDSAQCRSNYSPMFLLYCRYELRGVLVHYKHAEEISSKDINRHFTIHSFDITTENQTRECAINRELILSILWQWRAVPVWPPCHKISTCWQSRSSSYMAVDWVLGRIGHYNVLLRSNWSRESMRRGTFDVRLT